MSTWLTTKYDNAGDDEPALRTAMRQLAGACVEFAPSLTTVQSATLRTQVVKICTAKRDHVDDSVWSVEVAAAYGDVMRALTQ